MVVRKKEVDEVVDGNDSGEVRPEGIHIMGEMDEVELVRPKETGKGRHLSKRIDGDGARLRNEVRRWRTKVCEVFGKQKTHKIIPRAEACNTVDERLEIGPDPGPVVHPGI
jgi:hypothetical protein